MNIQKIGHAGQVPPDMPPIPLSLYIHIPWCESKCPYCDFNSHADEVKEEQYQQALLTDLQNSIRSHPYLAERPLHSVFIGGGTPSLLSGKFYAVLMEQLAGIWRLSADTEVTLESNPGSAEAKRFRDYFACGINRLSIGAQSFNQHNLSALGRLHTVRDIFSAAEHADAAGFKRINLDLMFGLPGQTAAQAEQDLRTAAQLGTEHLSRYQLTLEPGTLFYARPPSGLPNPDILAETESMGWEILLEYGFRRYEVSAFARQTDARSADSQCRHNLNYWRFGDYLGLGAGAHSKLTLPDGRVLRIRRKRGPAAYIGAAGMTDDGKQPGRTGRPDRKVTEIFADARTLRGLCSDLPANPFWGGYNFLKTEDKIYEFMLNAFRLVNGFPLGLFVERTGLPVAHLTDAIKEASELGLVALSENYLTPTGRGERMLNDLLLLFTDLPPRESKEVIYKGTRGRKTFGVGQSVSL